MPRRIRANKGYILLDALLAVVILAVGLLYVSRSLIATNRAAGRVLRHAEIAMIASEAEALVRASLLEAPKDTNWVVNGHSYVCTVSPGDRSDSPLRVLITVSWREQERIRMEDWFVVIPPAMTEREVEQ
ncbi:MAG: hypothetical protein ABIK83_06620 [Candidatus Zixiibacteriota bacterium]